ncbi:MAG: FixH family protein [Hyphomonadaceae bacterium]
MNTQSFTLKGGHVLAGLLLFFGAIIAINIAFAIAAVRTFPGEDVRRSYTQGLHYNDVLAERREQALIGWQAQTQLSSSESGARLIVQLHDANGAAIERATIDAVLRWAPNESGDQTLQFAYVGDGRYVAELGALRAGRWDLRARAHDAHGGALDFRSDLTWPTP